MSKITNDGYQQQWQYCKPVK